MASRTAPPAMASSSGTKPIVVGRRWRFGFEEALFLTRFGSSVTLIHRRDSFRASQIMVDRAKSQSDHHSDDQHSGDLHYRHPPPHRTPVHLLPFLA